ncbi:MAG TPA: hypothetical protein P5280_09995 [Cyclobacteriaceae bacterium]|nr:hypothetical protein [Cyclobacteriaceae bacterium]
MEIKDIKSQIKESLDHVPERVLKDVLEFLRQFENQSSDTVNLTMNLKDILTEDRELLERLAK